MNVEAFCGCVIAESHCDYIEVFEWEDGICDRLPIEKSVSFFENLVDNSDEVVMHTAYMTFFAQEKGTYAVFATKSFGSITAAGCVIRGVTRVVPILFFKGDVKPDINWSHIKELWAAGNPVNGNQRGKDRA